MFFLPNLNSVDCAVLDTTDEICIRRMLFLYKGDNEAIGVKTSCSFFENTEPEVLKVWKRNHLHNNTSKLLTMEVVDT